MLTARILSIDNVPLAIQIFRNRKWIRYYCSEELSGKNVKFDDITELHHPDQIFFKKILKKLIKDWDFIKVPVHLINTFGFETTEFLED